jgi:hypothetical protein
MNEFRNLKGLRSTSLPIPTMSDRPIAWDVVANPQMLPTAAAGDTRENQRSRRIPHNPGDIARTDEGGSVRGVIATSFGGASN